MKKTHTLILAAIAALLLMIGVGLWLSFNRSAKEVSDTEFEELEKRVDTYLKTPIKLSLDGSVKEMLPQEIGLKINPSVSLGISVKVDKYLLEETLDKNFKYKDSLPVSANFFFNEKGKLEIKEGRDGVVIDEIELIKNLKNLARNLNSVDLIKITSFKKTPEVSMSMLERERAKVEEMLNHKFTLLDPIYSDDWDLTLKDRTRKNHY